MRMLLRETPPRSRFLVIGHLHKRLEDVVPFSVKLVRIEIDLFQVLCSHIPAGRIFATIQPTGHGQPLRRPSPCNETDDCFVVPQRLTPPVR